MEEMIADKVNRQTILQMYEYNVESSHTKERIEGEILATCEREAIKRLKTMYPEMVYFTIGR